LQALLYLVGMFDDSRAARPKVVEAVGILMALDEGAE
jgi:hypothetical protein